jgi:hypothetical protein
MDRRLNEIGFIWDAFEAKSVITSPGDLSRPPCPPGGISLEDLSHLLPSRTVREARRWESNFLLLLQFRDREGHLRVPARHIEKNGYKLGFWLDNQRTQKKRGTLSLEKERRLNDIGFIWNVYEAHFDTMIRALKQFKQREGHCNVSEKHIECLEDGVKLKLGNWIRNQRGRPGRQMREALGADNREKVLASMGVKWSNPKQEIDDQALFDRNFDLLLVFNEREGHVRVPIQHQESANDHLGEWLKNQRSLHRNGLLELDRQKWLEVAGVTWEI